MKKSLKKIYYFFDKIYSYFYIKWKLKKLQKLNLKIKIIIGASSTKYKGWIKTNFYSLNLLKISTFENFFNFNEIDTILIEHVLEHLTKEEAKLAMNNCYKYLKKDGFIRIAVPDGNFKNQKYLDSVKPGGTGPGAKDHKVLYNFETIQHIFNTEIYTLRYLEYFDNDGNFIQNHWKKEDGFVQRSKDYDWRNKNGLNYTSLIVDAIKN
tara:strand:+ start:631 stop:1257 length:627 start_codon:yes stop_codon:yes gene_type:complete